MTGGHVATVKMMLSQDVYGNWRADPSGDDVSKLSPLMVAFRDDRCALRHTWGCTTRVERGRALCMELTPARRLSTRGSA